GMKGDFLNIFIASSLTLLNAFVLITDEQTDNGIKKKNIFLAGISFNFCNIFPLPYGRCILPLGRVQILCNILRVFAKRCLNINSMEHCSCTYCRASVAAADNIRMALPTYWMENQYRKITGVYSYFFNFWSNGLGWQAAYMASHEIHPSIKNNSFFMCSPCRDISHMEVSG
ncbi:MAG: hypothetical protein AABZ36_01995, partial [Nitrospirota bacterium]